MTYFNNALKDIPLADIPLTDINPAHPSQDIVIFPAQGHALADGAEAASSCRGDISSGLASGVAALREIIPLMLALLGVHFGRRGSVSMARQIRRDIGELYQNEKAAMAKLIKQALRSCPDWQARVFEDLGGMPALKRWQARLLRAHTPPPEEDYSWVDDDPATWPIMDEEDEPKTRRVRKRRPSSGPRLDRDGLFRWASIKQSRQQRHARMSHITRRDYQRESTFFMASKTRRPFAGPWPIEVIPFDILDPAEPEDCITLTINPHVIWDRLMALPRKWLSGLEGIREQSGANPETVISGTVISGTVISGTVLLCPD